MVPSQDRRAAVRAILGRDEAYDQDPKGDPPISVPCYRRAVRAAVDVTPDGVTGIEMSSSAAEPEAYSAGVRAALDVVVDAIAAVVGVAGEPHPVDEHGQTEG